MGSTRLGGAHFVCGTGGFLRVLSCWSAHFPTKPSNFCTSLKLLCSTPWKRVFAETSEEMLRVEGVLGSAYLLWVELDRRVRSNDEPRDEGVWPDRRIFANLYSCQGPIYIMEANRGRC